jgi:co-chaperonin GroES (HSP10)
MIQPYGGLLLVKETQESEKTTKSGIVISSAFSDNGPKTGTIIDMGDGEYNYKGELIPIIGLDIGDIVYYQDHSSIDIEDEDGTKYILLNTKNVLAKKSNSPAGFSPNKWSDDDDWNPITPFIGPAR